VRQEWFASILQKTAHALNSLHLGVVCVLMVGDAICLHCSVLPSQDKKKLEFCRCVAKYADDSDDAHMFQDIASLCEHTAPCLAHGKCCEVPTRGAQALQCWSVDWKARRFATWAKYISGTETFL
jgi:hypothetical protein